MRKAFTLIELMISIVLISIIMLFLYKSYSQLNHSNKTLELESAKIKKEELLKKTLYLDFTLAMSVKIINQDKREDVVFLQTRNSIHKRVNPYVAYIFKKKQLYRLESLRPFKEYPLSVDSEYVTDALGDCEIFRVYKSKNSKKDVFLIHILFNKKRNEEIILKVTALNIKKPPAKKKGK